MDKAPAVLYIFSGLPGVGKSTLAAAISKHIGATYLRIDTIEQGLKDIYKTDIFDQGYQLAFKMAADCLSLGISVVGDSCNTVAESRVAWQQVAINLGLTFVNIEVVCSNKTEHQHRVENRQSSIAHLKLPTWQQILTREYQPWETDVLKVDTAGQSTQQSVGELCALLNQNSVT